MSFTYYPKGVCSQKIQIELAKDHTIQDIQIIGGCDGNLKGVRALCIGQKAEDVIRSQRYPLRPEGHLLPGPDLQSAYHGAGPAMNTKARIQMRRSSSIHGIL